MSGDCKVRISRASNGYEVSVCDPAIEKANQKGGPNHRWNDPWCEYVFKTWDQVAAFLEKIHPVAFPKEEVPASFDAAYDAAMAEDDDEEDGDY